MPYISLLGKFRTDVRKIAKEEKSKSWHLYIVSHDDDGDDDVDYYYYYYYHYLKSPVPIQAMTIHEDSILWQSFLPKRMNVVYKGRRSYLSMTTPCDCAWRLEGV